MAKHLLIPELNLLLLDVDVLDGVDHVDPVADAAETFKLTKGSIAFKTQAVAKRLGITRYEAQGVIAKANQRGLIGR